CRRSRPSSPTRRARRRRRAPSGAGTACGTWVECVFFIDEVSWLGMGRRLRRDARAGRAPAGYRPTVAALCGVQFVDVLGVTSAIVAIPAMLRGVSAPPAATPLLATVYAMC